MHLLLFQEPKTTTEVVMLTEVAEQMSDMCQEDLAPLNTNASGHSPVSKQVLSAWALGGSEKWMSMFMQLLLLPWKRPLLK